MKFNGLEITVISVCPAIITESSKVAANVRIVLNDVFVIAGIKVMEGKFGLFISFPRSYDKEKQMGQNHAFPITKEFHEYITEKILTEYKHVTQFDVK
jgi:DNA-binding cell septation regulator SpoVG